jgi:hypothetical protein
VHQQRLQEDHGPVSDETAVHGGGVGGRGGAGGATNRPTIQSNADIARRLFIGEATVKTHINHAFAKTGVRDRAQAVAYAYRTGLARP